MNHGREGQVWWTLGAQKGVGQPPYAVRWRGIWWRTHPLKAAFGDGPSIEQDVLAFLRTLPTIPFGCVKLLETLTRSNRRFGDLPLLDSAAVTRGKRVSSLSGAAATPHETEK